MANSSLLDSMLDSVTNTIVERVLAALSDNTKPNPLVDQLLDRMGEALTKQDTFRGQLAVMIADDDNFNENIDSRAKESVEEMINSRHFSISADQISDLDDAIDHRSKDWSIDVDDVDGFEQAVDRAIDEKLEDDPEGLICNLIINDDNIRKEILKLVSNKIRITHEPDLTAEMSVWKERAIAAEKLLAERPAPHPFGDGGGGLSQPVGQQEHTEVMKAAGIPGY